MNHLTVDDIISYVSLDKLDNDALKLTTIVNEHIRQCPKCLKIVSAFQIIYDEFIKLDSNDAFEKYVLNSGICKTQENKKANEYEKEELEDFR